MNGEVVYEFFESEKIILEKFIGEISFDILVNSRKHLYNDHRYQSEYALVADLRKATLKLSIAELQEFIDFLIANGEYVNGRKTSIIADTPQNVALSVLLKQHQDKIGSKIEVCCTTEGAFNWIGSNRKIDI
ncbi:hypothetical protein JXR93_02685 [bacterium]|nr:hypothetical protein [bacterium]